LALSCATILDPRYKATFFKYCFRKIYGSEGVRDQVEKVINTLRMWLEEYMRVSSSRWSQNIEPSTSYSAGNFNADDNQAESDDWMCLSLNRHQIRKCL